MPSRGRDSVDARPPADIQRRRTLRRVLQLALAASPGIGPSAGFAQNANPSQSAGEEDPQARQILQRADEIRFPKDSFQVEARITSTSGGQPQDQRAGQRHQVRQRRQFERGRAAHAGVEPGKAFGGLGAGDDALDHAQRRVERRRRPGEPGIPGRRLHRRKFRIGGAVAQKVAVAVVGNEPGHLVELGGDLVDRGIRRAGDGHDAGVDLAFDLAPFRGNRLGHGFGRQDQCGFRGRADRLAVEPHIPAAFDRAGSYVRPEALRFPAAAHGSSSRKGSAGTSSSDQPRVFQVRAIWSGRGAIRVTRLPVIGWSKLSWRA